MTNPHGKNLNWRQWLENADNLPGAAYVIRNDESLSLLGGNDEFYTLFCCTPAQMQQKYAGNLGAIADSEPLAALPKPGNQVLGPFSFPQQIMRDGSEAWIFTELYLCPDENGSVLCCLSTDITDYQNNTKEYFDFVQAVHLATGKTGVEYFQYNPDSDVATVLSSFSILQRRLANTNGVIENFTEKMVSDGYVCSGHHSTFIKAMGTAKQDIVNFSCEFQMFQMDKGNIWVRLTILHDKNAPQPICILENVSQEKEAVRNYLNETQFYQAILTEKSAFAQVDVTDNRITRTGGIWNLYNEIINKVSYSQLIEEFINKVVHPEDRAPYLEIMQCDTFKKSIDSGVDHLDCDFRRIVDQNKMVWMHLDVHLFSNPINHHLVALITIQNIDAQKKLEYLQKHHGHIERMTNMYNKSEVESIIREHLAHDLSQHRCAFLLLDVDGLDKLMDDKNSSDNVLTRIRDVLSKTFRRSDIISGYSQDEFLIFIKNIHSRDQIGQRMNDLFSALIAENLVPPLSYSAGITISDELASYDQLFHEADCALFAAKSSGVNQYLFYQPKHNRESTRDTWTQDSDQLVPAEAINTQTSNFEQLTGKQGDIAYLIDPVTYDLICGNQAFYDRLGLSDAQCKGMKCYEAMHNRKTPCPFCSKANWPTDKYYMWRDVNTFLEQEFLIKNKLINWHGKEALLAFAIDISNDKSIVDSLGHDAMESHALISGVQHMVEAKDTDLAMESALETIGIFFRADSAYLWRYEPSLSGFCRSYGWQMGKNPSPSSADDDLPLTEWIETQAWDQPIMIESPESMLGQSYEMYQSMKSMGILNSRWIRVRQKNEVLGYISINNVCSNIENTSFLESFTVFVGSELEKRNLIDISTHNVAYDELTGVHSHKHFEKFISSYHPDHVACIGVIVANFNNIKGINNARGFEMGNYYIKQFADILKRVFRDRHLFRIGGDEFLIVLPEVARDAMDDHLSQLDAQISEHGAFTVSIGHSWDDVENDLHLLIDQATQAMKVNKRRHYDSQPDMADVERRKMLSELVTNIEKGAFEVFLQPKVNLETEEVIGAEALIRYYHPQMGYIPPASFIEILEKNHFIRYIDLFVFEEVCKRLESWKKQGLFLPIISVNFSRLTMLEKDILSSMESIISRYDVSRDNIEIEITESIASMGKSMLYKATRTIYEAGYSISLDDFGTKYTNLSILADLNFSILKADKSLVGALNSRPNYRLVMKNVISMCHDLGMDVIAEGIETQEQQEILRSLGCDLGQGYLYGRPMPISEFVNQHILTKPMDNKK